MSKILVCEKAPKVPYFKHYSFEAIEEWGQALRDSIPKTLEAILKGVPDNETFRTKIVKLLIVAVRKMLGNGFIGPQGLPQKLRLEIMKARLTGEDAAKNFIDCVKLAEEAFDQGELNSAMIAYYLGTSFGPHRFRDAIELTLKLLTPYIQPAKQGSFSSKLNNQVLRSGKLITDLAYHPDIRKQENYIINSLINKDLARGCHCERSEAIPLDCHGLRPRNDDMAGIVPFTTGGDSHCDFILIKDSIRLYYSTEPKEIKYETYKRFISEKHANKLKSLWPVIDESIRPNPDEYIGHPEKPAYFDMELSVQISKRE